MYRCSVCTWVIENFKTQCPMCKQTNSFAKARKREIKTFIEGTDIANEFDDEPEMIDYQRASVKASDIEDLNLTVVETGFKAFDKAVGGVIKKSAHCITGDPGVGKTTLMTQICNLLTSSRKKGLYCSSEMSLPMVKNYAKRLGPWNEWSDRRFNFLQTDDVRQIISEIGILRPLFVVVDSLNYTRDPTIESNVNTVPQLIACAKLLHEAATKYDCCIFSICHVTKDGDLSGPMAMKHAVDAIWFLKYRDSLEQFQRNGEIKLFADGKNRFGSVQGEQYLRMSKDTGILESIQ